MQFTITSSDPNSSARTGLLRTVHGDVPTPVFMPVGTLGSVKCVDQDTLADVIGSHIILANTYHLYLRPGITVVAGAGGIHQFTGWSGPMLTDSGGYQVYSLSQMRKITEDGVSFRSHIDGSAHSFRPESTIDIQRQIGADIIMAFDECTPYPCDLKYATKSMHLTHRWLDRCVEHFSATDPVHGYDQALAPIVQGSVYPALRKESAEYVATKDMDINAIGGLSVGEPAEDMYAMTELVCGILPTHQPRYLMGVGTPVNLLECIALGVDMFDCVLPTRNARHGKLYTRQGEIHIKNKKWKNDHSPVDAAGSPWSATYTKAYLRHLVQSKETLGAMICSVHNLHFYTELMREAQRRIQDGSFKNWKDSIVKDLTVRL
jgi:queuine tRNA-ribosyltransferase